MATNTSKAAVARVTQAAAHVAAQDGVSLIDLVRAVSAAQAVQNYTDSPPSAPVVTLPSSPVISDEQLASLITIKDALSSVQFPDQRRTLNDAEKRDLLGLLKKIKNIGDVVKKVEEALKASWFNHFDVVAENTGMADKTTARHSTYGWYLLEDKTSGVVPGEDKKATRETRAGAVSVSATALKALVDSGAIERKHYLDATVQTRVVDEGKFLRLIREHPELASVLSSAFQIKPPTISFNLRNKD